MHQRWWRADRVTPVAGKTPAIRLKVQKFGTFPPSLSCCRICCRFTQSVVRKAGKLFIVYFKKKKKFHPSPDYLCLSKTFLKWHFLIGSVPRFWDFFPLPAQVEGKWKWETKTKIVHVETGFEQSHLLSALTCLSACPSWTLIFLSVATVL